MLAEIVATLSLVAAAPAERPSIEVIAFRDPWTARTKRELGLERVRTRRCSERESRPNLRIQNRESTVDPRAKLRRALDPRWGSMWFDNCDGGRLKVGVAHDSRTESSRRVRAARRVLRRVGLHRDTDLVAVRSTTRRLADAQERLLAPFDDLFERGLISAGRDDEFNAIIVSLARTIPAEDRARLERASRRVGVNVTFENVRSDDVFVEPLGGE